MGIRMMLRKFNKLTCADLRNLHSERALRKLVSPPLIGGGYTTTCAALSPVAGLAQIGFRDRVKSQPITDDELRVMMLPLVRMGVALGEFTQERVDRVRGGL